MKKIGILCLLFLPHILLSFTILTKDGRKIDAEFLGVKKDVLYFQQDEILYMITKNNIKRIDDKYVDITGEIFAHKKMKRINWNSVTETVKIIDKDGKKERSDKKKRKESEIRKISKRIWKVSNLKLIVNDTTSVLLSWDTKRKKNRIDHFFVDKKIGEENWIENFAKINRELTTWEDTDIYFNVPIFYRVGVRYKSKISPFTKVKKIFVVKDDFIEIEPQKIKNQSQDREIELTYNIAVSQFEITNQEYVKMLNFAFKRQLITGNYVQNITVKNKYGTPKELIDLDDQDTKIRYIDGKFRASESYKNYPVTEVTWYGAVFYCNMLSEQLKDETEYVPVYDLSSWQCISPELQGYRLPTESEWEVIAKDNIQKTYPWGNSTEVEHTANVKEEKKNEITPVGSFSPYGDSNKGVSDLIGNVAEWCYDWYTINPVLSVKNPVNKQISKSRVIRGGSWQDSIHSLSIEYRDRAYPNESYNNIGFRVVRPFPRKEEEGRNKQSQNKDKTEKENLYDW